MAGNPPHLHDEIIVTYSGFKLSGLQKIRWAGRTGGVGSWRGGWGGGGGYRRRSFAVGYFETVIIQQFALYLPFCCQVAGDCVAVAFQEELRPKSQ